MPTILMQKSLPISIDAYLQPGALPVLKWSYEPFPKWTSGLAESFARLSPKMVQYCIPTIKR